MRRIFKLENKNFTDLNPLQLGIEEFKNEQVSVLEIRDYYTIYYIAAGKGSFSNRISGIFSEQRRFIFGKTISGCQLCCGF